MVEFATGSTEQVLIVEEDGGYGSLNTNTFAADGWHIGYNVQISNIQSTNNLQSITNNGSNSLELVRQEKGAEMHGFQIRFNPYDWKWLKFCSTHQIVVDNDEGGYYSHTFDTSGSDSNSFALQRAIRQETDNIPEYYGCVITDFRLEFTRGTGERDAFITVIANCVAKKKVDGGSIASVAYPTLEAFKFHHVTLTFAGNEVKELNSGSLKIGRAHV